MFLTRSLKCVSLARQEQFVEIFPDILGEDVYTCTAFPNEDSARDTFLVAAIEVAVALPLRMVIEPLFERANEAPMTERWLLYKGIFKAAFGRTRWWAFALFASRASCMPRAAGHEGLLVQGSPAESGTRRIPACFSRTCRHWQAPGKDGLRDEIGRVAARAHCSALEFIFGAVPVLLRRAREAIAAWRARRNGGGGDDGDDDYEGQDKQQSSGPPPASKEAAKAAAPAALSCSPRLSRLLRISRASSDTGAPADPPSPSRRHFLASPCQRKSSAPLLPVSAAPVSPEASLRTPSWRSDSRVSLSVPGRTSAAPEAAGDDAAGEPSSARPPGRRSLTWRIAGGLGGSDSSLDGPGLPTPAVSSPHRKGALRTGAAAAPLRRGHSSTPVLSDENPVESDASTLEAAGPPGTPSRAYRIKWTVSVLRRDAAAAGISGQQQAPEGAAGAEHELPPRPRPPRPEDGGAGSAPTCFSVPEDGFVDTDAEAGSQFGSLSMAADAARAAGITATTTMTTPRLRPLSAVSVHSAGASDRGGIEPDGILLASRPPSEGAASGCREVATLASDHDGAAAAEEASRAAPRRPPTQPGETAPRSSDVSLSAGEGGSGSFSAAAAASGAGSSAWPSLHVRTTAGKPPQQPAARAATDEAAPAPVRPALRSRMSLAQVLDAAAETAAAPDKDGAKSAAPAPPKLAFRSAFLRENVGDEDALAAASSGPRNSSWEMPSKLKDKEEKEKKEARSSGTTAAAAADAASGDYFPEGAPGSSPVAGAAAGGEQESEEDEGEAEAEAEALETFREQVEESRQQVAMRAASVVAVYLVWALMVWFIWTYGLLIYSLMGEGTEDAFAREWGIGCGCAHVFKFHFPAEKPPNSPMRDSSTFLTPLSPLRHGTGSPWTTSPSGRTWCTRRSTPESCSSSSTASASSETVRQKRGAAAPAKARCWPLPAQPQQH